MKAPAEEIKKQLKFNLNYLKRREIYKLADYSKMDFMISLFGSEQTGRPKLRRRISSSKTVKTSNSNNVQTMASSTVPKKFRPHLPPEDDEGNVEYKVSKIKLNLIFLILIGLLLNFIIIN